MLTSPLYDTTVAHLQRSLPSARPSQVATLSLLLVATMQAQSCQLAKLARGMPLDTSQVVKEQRIRRFLDNPRITQADHYQPLVQRAVHGLKGQRVQLLLDRVLIRNDHNILMLSLAFRRRSIPLAWMALPHQGASAIEERQTLIRQAVALLPAGVRISIHGDSEFRALEFFQWIRAQGYDAMLGVVGYGLVATTSTGVDAAGQSTQQTLAERVGTARGMVTLTGVYVGTGRYGPVNILAWWEHDPDGQRVMRGAMTNLPATAHTKALGKRRMWIETVFRDWQSGGFHLDRSGLMDRQRLERLLIVLALAYLWIVCLGRWVVKRGYRHRLDSGTAHRWQTSLFQLGVGWMQRMQSFGQPLPIMLHIYL